MGTALVRFESQKAWEATHNLQHKIAKKRKNQERWFWIWALVLAGATVLVAILSYSNLNLSGFTVLILLCALLLGACIIVLRDLLQDGMMVGLFGHGFSYPQPFDCPTCIRTVELGEKWQCGHCRERHEHDGLERTTIFLGCQNSECDPVPGLPRHRQQAAFQCPHCKDHVILNPLLYKSLGSNSRASNYLGVARFLDDNSPPALGGKPIEDVPDVGQLSASEFIEERLKKL